jgi:small-conductance mechanosensitive channel
MLTVLWLPIQRAVTGAVPSFEPFIRYHTFNQSSIDLTVILRAQTFVDKYLIKHDFIKALQEPYRKEQIEIPFPIRTLHMAYGSEQKISAGEAPPASLKSSPEIGAARVVLWPRGKGESPR